VKEQTPLAWTGYPPAPLHPVFARDLETPAQVDALFGYCSILEAHFEAAGWQHLVRRFGLAQLIAIDRAGPRWFWEDDPEAGLLYWSRIAGYDPASDSFGAYDEASGVFTQFCG
jgi:hypothetical protein